MEEKQICCCGSSTWTRVIAWFEIIASVIATILWILAVIGAIAVLSLDVKNAKHSNGTPFTPEEIQGYKSVGTTTLVISIVMLLLAVLAFVMGIILLRGSINRNPRQLHSWIVYTVISMVIWGVKTIVECIVYSSAAGLAFANIFISFALALAFQGFSLWVVITHKKDIEASTGPAFPVKA